MNSFKEKFKIAKILASLFTHSSTPEEKKNYHAWLDENPEHQKIADRILNKVGRVASVKAVPLYSQFTKSLER